MRKKTCCFICLTLLAFFIFAFGLIFGFLAPAELNNVISGLSAICDTGSESYKSWASNKNSEAPSTYLNYYAFNITNPVEYLTQTTPYAISATLNTHGAYSFRKYEAKYNISFNSNKDKVSFNTFYTYSFESGKSCSSCSVNDRLTNFNPVFLSLLTQTGSEHAAGLILSSFNGTSCNLTTISYSINQTTCNPTTDPMCCCDQAAAANETTSCTYRASFIYSTFAAFDNGIQITTQAGNTVNSALFTTKTVYENIFGYPSAIAGLVEASTLSLDTLNTMATYTQNVLRACNFSSTGRSLGVNDQSDNTLKQFASITCSPVAGVQYWVDKCSNFGVDGCKCVNSEHGIGGVTDATRPCCTLSGLGCLSSVSGSISEKYFATQDQSYAELKGKDLAVQATGCGSHSKGQEFWYNNYMNTTKIPTWTTNTRTLYSIPSISELTNWNLAKAYNATVMGGDGTRFKGTGRTSEYFSGQLSSGNPYLTSIVIYFPEMVRPQTISSKGSESYKGITVNRFTPAQTFLDQGVLADPPGNIDNGALGAATPYSGLQDVSYINGFPSYVSRPFFLYNKNDLLTKGITVTNGGSSASANADDHETYYLVEPSTGLTFLSHKRLMTSFALFNCTNSTAQLCKSGSGLTGLFTPNVPGGVIVPQFYFDESSSVPSSVTDYYGYLLQGLLGAECVLVIMTVLGFFGWIIGTACLIRRRGSDVTSRSSLITK
eukprot:c21409_g1_i1.p1 GENE.c21409_g1_i1~~c21409_g1_i1.p1  ORF type:complete len:725 (+),score=229.94 c21409_g1_i1:26-2176(+)